MPLLSEIRSFLSSLDQYTCSPTCIQSKTCHRFSLDHSLIVAYRAGGNQLLQSLWSRSPPERLQCSTTTRFHRPRKVDDPSSPSIQPEQAFLERNEFGQPASWTDLGGAHRATCQTRHSSLIPCPGRSRLWAESSRISFSTTPDNDAIAGFAPTSCHLAHYCHLAH